MSQAGPNSCGKALFCGKHGREGRPQWPINTCPWFRWGSFLTSALGLSGEWLEFISPQLYYSVGVLLQLNISTRLSVGPSRSVIYTIFTNSWLWIDWHFREFPVWSRNLLNLSPAAEQEFCSLNLSLNYRFMNRKLNAPKCHGSSLPTHLQFQFPL